MSQLSDKNRIVRLDADDHPNPLHSDSLKSTVSTLQSDVTVEFDPPSAVHQSPAFHSTIYRSLAEPCSPLEDKVRAGYKLIDGQRRDIARMMNKVSDLRAAHEGKQSAIEQL
ncbi:hypothetical protein BSKO_01790 [Bryopsis sp. KO-2023]|nr:hypothetical protein BSKO_01790 [Bryopsis sp. KO-2023]